MRYHSTRSCENYVSGAQAILTGLAPDGGLFVPEAIPHFPLESLTDLTPREIAATVVGAYFPDLPETDALVSRAYEGKFSAPDLTPTVTAGPFTVLELFHGPTAAFKDVALCMLPHLVVSSKAVLGRTEETFVLTATSGDTGKAAMAGFQDVAGTRICVFYPHGGVSPVQRKQMVTQEGNNVFVAAVKGNFDDAQTGVKAIFAQDQKPCGVEFTTANSMNVGRLAPQIFYYFKAYADLVRRGEISLGDKVNFAVPTGNFGNILAGFLAGKMGLPVGKLICASNANRILTDVIESGVYDRRRPFFKTLSPSMDILISSNFERLLYLLSGDCDLVADWMKQLSEKGWYTLPEQVHRELKKHFCGFSCSDAQTRETIDRVFGAHGYLCDPHTAAAWYGAACYRKESGDKTTTVVLSTASPYKFPRAVLGEDAENEFELLRRLQEKTGVPIPSCLEELETKQERHLDVIEKDRMLSYVMEKGEKR